MADEYDTVDENPRSDFASMRDSLYLLATLNQYSITPKLLDINRLHKCKPAEGLLRLALFSKDLRLLKRQPVRKELGHRQPVIGEAVDSEDAMLHSVQAVDHTDPEARLEPQDELNEMRQRMAQQFRLTRRKGVVPVFISTLWFLFALAISIQSSFSDVGWNEVAHDLALGLLLSWLPVLMLSSIIDRNPASADDIRKQLNRLIDHVRKSLMDDRIRHDFLDTVANVPEHSDMQQGIEEISQQCRSFEPYDFFEKFSGQGRQPWHYGAAHGILCDIEDAYVAREGRHWLRNEKRARTFLVLGKREGALDWLDYRELWQLAAAFLCVGGTTFGAFLLSFFTPTVGLGCRSGGYTIFFAVASGLVILEVLLWWYWDAKKPKLQEFWRRATLQDNFPSNMVKLCRIFLPLTTALTAVTGRCLATIKPPLAKVRAFDKLTELSQQQRWMYCFFRPLEFLNTVLLLWLSLSQTFGADNNCYCMSSTWAGGGGYLDLTQWNTANSAYVRRYWIAGTTIGVAVMGLFMTYLVLEWCIQSHLSTADRKSAAYGLRNVRRFRRLALPIRWLLERLDDFVHVAEEYVSGRLKFYVVRPSGLRWSKNTRASRTTARSRSMTSGLPPPVPHRESSNMPLVRLQFAEGYDLARTPVEAHVASPYSHRLSDKGGYSPEDPRGRLLSSSTQGLPDTERRSSSGASSRYSAIG